MPIARVLEPEVMDTPEEAADYDAMDHAQVNERFVVDLLALVAEPALVLDLGTGTARIPLLLCARAKTTRVIAVELADHMLRLAAKNVQDAGMSGRVTLLKDDAKAAREPGEPFAVVCSNSLLHHIEDPGAALAAWWARVPPGGLLFVRDLVRPDTYQELEALVARYSGTPPDGEGRQGWERQVKLFRESLHAALQVDEVRALVAPLGIPQDGVSSTGDRHFTLAFRRPT